jgi:hypothetical protein
MSEITEITEAPVRYTITFTNGQTKQITGAPDTVVVASNAALKITSPSGVGVTWHSPSAWRSLEIHPQLKT